MTECVLAGRIRILLPYSEVRPKFDTVRSRKILRKYSIPALSLLLVTGLGTQLFFKLIIFQKRAIDTIMTTTSLVIDCLNDGP